MRGCGLLGVCGGGAVVLHGELWWVRREALVWARWGGRVGGWLVCDLDWIVMFGWVWAVAVSWAGCCLSWMCGLGEVCALLVVGCGCVELEVSVGLEVAGG